MYLFCTTREGRLSLAPQGRGRLFFCHVGMMGGGAQCSFRRWQKAITGRVVTQKPGSGTNRMSRCQTGLCNKSVITLKSSESNTPPPPPPPRTWGGKQRLPANWEDPVTRSSVPQGGSSELQTETFRRWNFFFFFFFKLRNQTTKPNGSVHALVSDSLKITTKYQNDSEFMVKTTRLNRTTNFMVMRKYKLVDTDISWTYLWTAPASSDVNIK